MKGKEERKLTLYDSTSRSFTCLGVISLYPRINHIKILLFMLCKWYSETQRDLATCPRSTIGKWQSWKPNPGVHSLRQYTWLTSRPCSFRAPKIPYNLSVQSPGFPNSPCPICLCGESANTFQREPPFQSLINFMGKAKRNILHPMCIWLWFLAVQPETLL